MIEPGTSLLSGGAIKLENAGGTIINPSTDGASTLTTGLTTVTTAGTRVQFPTNTCVSVVIKALQSNTGLIYVGNSTVSSSSGFQLSADDSVAFDINNTNIVYIDSSANSQSVTWLMVNY